MRVGCIVITDDIYGTITFGSVVRTVYLNCKKKNHLKQWFLTGGPWTHRKWSAMSMNFFHDYQFFNINFKTFSTI